MYHAAPPPSSVTAGAGLRLQAGRGLHSRKISRSIRGVLAPAGIRPIRTSRRRSSRPDSDAGVRRSARTRERTCRRPRASPPGWRSRTGDRSGPIRERVVAWSVRLPLVRKVAHGARIIALLRQSAGAPSDRSTASPARGKRGPAASPPTGYGSARPEGRRRSR